MKPIRFVLSLFISFCIVLSCSHTDHKLIIGKWKGVEWVAGTQESPNTPSDAVFTFNEDGSYTFDYAGNIEKGKYFVTGDQLFTTPDGGIKMMVKIPKLTQDTLVFDMNRGGQAERLTLKRN